jgi:hypothetical protein
MNGTVNHPTDAQSEQLAFLTEEMGEAQQVVGKIGRHGLDSRWPKPDGQTNTQMLEKEVGHVLAAIDIMVERGMLDPKSLAMWRRDKLQSVQPWLHCQENIDAARAVWLGDAVWLAGQQR